MNQELKNIIQEYEGEIDVELIKAIFVSETSNERYESSCDDLDNLSALAWNLFESNNQKFKKIFISNILLFRSGWRLVY